jgi:hypothetical protein
VDSNNATTWEGDGGPTDSSEPPPDQDWEVPADIAGMTDAEFEAEMDKMEFPETDVGPDGDMDAVYDKYVSSMNVTDLGAKAERALNWTYSCCTLPYRNCTNTTNPQLPPFDPTIGTGCQLMSEDYQTALDDATDGPDAGSGPQLGVAETQVADPTEPSYTVTAAVTLTGARMVMLHSTF